MILTEIMLIFLYFSSDDNVVKFQDNKKKEMNLIKFLKYITESDIQIFPHQGIVKSAILNINILTL